jgi:hypothetical protein
MPVTNAAHVVAPTAEMVVTACPAPQAEAPPYALTVPSAAASQRAEMTVELTVSLMDIVVEESVSRTCEAVLEAPVPPMKNLNVPVCV